MTERKKGVLTELNSKISRLIASLGRESARQTAGRTTIDRDREMIAITPDTGKFFSVLLRAIRANRVLEIGTSSGYSTLWFADALLASATSRPRPLIMTIESNPAKVKWARKNFRQAGVESIVRILEGQAISVLRDLNQSDEKFDFVFIDADKENIISYFEHALPMTRIGGIIAADNMLFPEHFRPHMKKYASHLSRRKDVQTVTVPIGMGQEVSVRLR